MGLARRIILPGNAPGGFVGMENTLFGPIITARSSFHFWGDESTIVQSGGKVTSWTSRSGSNAYGQTDNARRPDHVASGGPGGSAFLRFSGTADANGDWMTNNWSNFSVSQAVTIIDFLATDDVSATRYIDGRVSGDDNISSFISAPNSGQFNCRYGNATAAVPIRVASNFRVISRSWDGTGFVECQGSSTYSSATATILPTTTRAIGLGSNDALAAGSLWDGDVAMRMIFRESMSADWDFFVNVVGKKIQIDFGLVSNPIFVP